MKYLLRNKGLSASLMLLFPWVSLATPAWSANAWLQSGNKEYPLELEIADTRAVQEKGLMHRAHLPDDYGMLFLYSPPQHVRMWMKDTPLSLDMLFLDAEGNVVHVAEHTTPGSLESISASQPVRAVLEMKAGTVQRLGLRPGDRLLHERLQP